MEQLLSRPAENNGDENEEEGKAAKPAVPEKRRNKFLDQATWKHDRELVETARRIAEVMGEILFEDHNIFREQFDTVAKNLGIKLGASDKKAILHAVSWRVETA